MLRFIQPTAIVFIIGTLFAFIVIRKGRRKHWASIDKKAESDIFARYKESEYQKITSLSPYEISSDIGKRGEYLTYLHLEAAAPKGTRFLFNLYVPCYSDTTEIDEIAITKYGIIVIESKNYGGEIRGKKKESQWIQTTINKGKKIKRPFYNPFLQNRTHVNCLIRYLKEKGQVGMPIYSLIVFGSTCDIRKTPKRFSHLLYSKRIDAFIAKRDTLCWFMRKLFRRFSTNECRRLSGDDQRKIYDILLPLTKASEKTKKDHIAGLR